MNDERPQAGAIPRPQVIKASQIVKDIESGLTLSRLMKKYGLTRRGLRWALMLLISSGAITLTEICKRLAIQPEELVLDKRRGSKRYRLNSPIRIHDVGNPHRQGTVRDLSETGIGVRGMNSKVGERKTLVISADEFGEFATIMLEAACRWSNRTPHGDYAAGFEILDISMGNAVEFKLLKRLVELADSPRARPSDATDVDRHGH